MKPIYAWVLKGVDDDGEYIYSPYMGEPWSLFRSYADAKYHADKGERPVRVRVEIVKERK